jgi:hypothetical protein
MFEVGCAAAGGVVMSKRDFFDGVDSEEAWTGFGGLLSAGSLGGGGGGGGGGGVACGGL